MNATWPRLPSGPSLTSQSFAVLGAAASVGKDVHAERPGTARVPTAVALRAGGDLVQHAHEALHPGLYRHDTPAEMGARFDALRQELAASASFVPIGPGNRSATFHFAERARAPGLATHVGQAAGGNLRGINGGAFFFLKLPACGLEVDVPLIARFAPGNPPDVEVRSTFESVVHAQDLEMAAVQRLLG